MRELLLAAAGGAAGKLYVEDVFSAYPYTGTGAALTITNGVDLADNGGMVWVKERSAGNYSVLSDTIRGATNTLRTEANNSEINYSNSITAFSASGFTVGANSFCGTSGSTYASWTFRRAPKFFDVVTWTGDGTSNRQIPHALGIAPGVVTAKRRDAAGDWVVWHRSATGDLYLDTTAAPSASFTQITATSATTFSVSGNANISGATYVAYVWAHDASASGVVQCGSFTSDSSANVTVNLGWEPQFLLVKITSGSGDWRIVDSARGFTASGTEPYLAANLTNAEGTTTTLQAPTATGFTFNGQWAAGTTGVYLAVRRGSMRTPTSGTQVYNAIARTGTGAVATVTGVGFSPDLMLTQSRQSGGKSNFIDRLRGGNKILFGLSSNAEASASDLITSFNVDGVTLGADASQGYTNNSAQGGYIEWFFRRAPGFFDIVCDTGTGVAHTVTHNLGATPGLIIRKGRSAATVWQVWHSALANTQKLELDNNAAPLTDATTWNSTNPTSTNFSVGIGTTVNTSAATYVTYLFAALPGVSSIGSYTGNGATQTINCGFASGARFVLIKRTDSTGDWLVLDTVRGIISGNDPYLALDTTAAEVTTADLLTPQSVGFGLTSNALVNANGGNFIYFAVA